MQFSASALALPGAVSGWLAMACAALSALCCYLSSRHQSIWPVAPPAARLLRAASVLGCGAAWLLAAAGYGAWCGLFFALSGVMLALVALPYLDAWQRTVRQKRDGHVG